mgnify:CR=1 FL=1
MKKAALIILSMSLLLSCSKEQKTANEQPSQAGEQPVAAKIVRLDSALTAYAGMSAEQRTALLQRPELALLMQTMGDTLTEASLAAFAESRVVAMFGTAAKEVFPGEIEAVTAAGNGVLAGLGVKTPELVGVVLPYQQSIIFCGDSVAFVSLNHWLGADHPAYNGFAEYVKRTKTPAHMPIDIAEALIANTFPFSNEQGTLLSRLIYEGALMQAITQATGADVKTVLGWTDDELAAAQKGERYAWETLVRRKMLYDKDEDLQQRLVRPAPNSGVISPDLPGGMGRFIGYQLVQSLLKNEPSLTLRDIFEKQLYLQQETLSQSRYAP